MKTDDVRSLWLLGLATSWGAILTAACLLSSPSFAQHEAVPEADKWIKRLTENANRLVGDEGLKDHQRQYFRRLAVYVLARSQRIDAAMKFAQGCTDAAERPALISSIADGQSTNDDLAGAFQTVDLLPDGSVKEMTIRLIVIRQAQRGDLDDAVKLLDRIPSVEGRHRALPFIIDACLKARSPELAESLLDRITDDEVRKRVRGNIERSRNKPKPEDPDFARRTIEQAREDRAVFSKEDEEFLRLTCQARVAMQQKDDAAFKSAMQSARDVASQWSPAKRRAPLLAIGSIFHEYGDAAATRQAFREVLTSLLEPDERVLIDFVRIALASNVDGHFEAIVNAVPPVELERWVADLTDHDEVSDLLGGFAQAVVACGKYELAERSYEKLRTDQQRFQISAGVLEALAKRKLIREQRRNNSDGR